MIRFRFPFVTVLGPVLLLGLMLTACGTDDDTASRPVTSTTRDRMEGGKMEHDHGEMTPVAAGARRIEVKATSFTFDPDEITIAAGEDVAIVLSSDDLLHDFTIDKIDVHVAADRNETAEGGLRADKPGRYTYYCTVAGHREAGMEGTLIVEAP